ncbi:uncharacterized protein LOC125758372 [Rhipicephalus sanguineus]|uniref:uncharacterized protein LOC125758372 n=1 Tax=Rhipicephalus sanguineus TaxID=34632 RepID=UPI0020C2C200|nr:uncharacterized protein LOC125758372 [Rhipicephalus sanguineus]
MSKKVGKGHKACCAALWCNNSGRNSAAKFFRFPADDRCDVWRNYIKRADLEGLTREQMYNGYRLCSDHFAESAFANPAKTRLLWTAVPTVAVEVGSPIDEGPSLAEATAAAAQEHPRQKSIAQIADSSQTPVHPESPMPGPSGLSTCGRADECAPCPETSGQDKPTSTPSHRGPKRKVYSPKTAAVIKRLKIDAQR